MTARSISRSVARPLSGSIVGRVVSSISELQSLINDLFGDGQQGLFAVFEPVVLDEQRLYKLSDFTDPVTADGDPTGGGKEVSGNDNHLTQSVSADRPTYNTDGTLHWLAGDGSGDFIRVDRGVALEQPTTHFIAFKLRSTGATQNIFNGVLDDASGTGNVQYLAEVDGQFQVSAGSPLNVQAVDTATHVMTIVFDGANSYVRVDGVQVASGNAGAKPWRGTTLFANEQDGLPGEVDAYGYIARTGIPTSDIIDRAESYLADLVGITL